MGARTDAWGSTSTASRRDRRSDAVVERVRRDFEGGVRAGVMTTPTVFVDGVATGVPRRVLDDSRCVIRHIGRIDAPVSGALRRDLRRNRYDERVRIPKRHAMHSADRRAETRKDTYV